MYKLIYITIVLTVAVNTAMALSGSGGPTDPWLIESLSDFNEFAADANYWSGYVRLETDLDLSGLSYNTAVIAADTDSSNETFEGTNYGGFFDGNNCSISNLTIDAGATGNDYLGLFGRIASAEIKNLRIVDCNITGSNNSVFLAGLAAYDSSADINNCSAGGVISCGDSAKYVGMLTGYTIGPVHNCCSDGIVKTGNYSNYIGGLAGRSDEGDIIDSYSTCSIDSSTVSGLNWVGGLIGFKFNGGTVSGCYSTGQLSVGYNAYYIGGLIGGADTGSTGILISNCYSSSSISLANNPSQIGGLIGYSHVNCDVNNCHSTGNISGFYASGEMGGLVGTNRGGITASWSTSNLTAGGGMDTTADRIGGLVGLNDDAVINKCYSGGNITKPSSLYSCSSSRAGGLVGNNLGTIRQSCSAAGVWGNLQVGGLVGRNHYGDVNDCYSIGPVTGVGGSPANLGGLIGYASGSSTANSFWDAGTSGMDSSAGGVSKTTKQMRQKSTFTDAGWDFENTWDIKGNLTYPYLLYYNKADLNTDGIVNMYDLAVLADNWLEGGI